MSYIYGAPILDVYVRKGCTGTGVGVEGFVSLSQVYFDNMFRPMGSSSGHTFLGRLLVCNVLMMYTI